MTRHRRGARKVPWAAPGSVPTPLHRQRGFAALELAAGVAVLVLPVALLVAGLPEWAARQSLARQAAREAARVVALAGACDTAVADRVVGDVRAGAHLDAGELGVALECVPDRPLPRDGVVTVRVTVAMPALAVPLVGNVAGWRWTAVHRQPVDPYGSIP